MQINNFKEMYLAELSELRSLEEQLTRALKTMADTAKHDGLKQAFTRHLEETQSQQARITQILRSHNVNPEMHEDQAMARLIEEAEKMARILSRDDLRDAGLIASAQKIEHYEIAAYGSAAAFAGMLGLGDDQATLHTILEEEKSTDEKLTVIAEEIVNQDAARQG